MNHQRIETPQSRAQKAVKAAHFQSSRMNRQLLHLQRALPLPRATATEQHGEHKEKQEKEPIHKIPMSAVRFFIVFFMRIETRTVAAGKVAMAIHSSTGETLTKLANESTQRLTLRHGAGVGRLAGSIEPANVADADTRDVIALTMGTHTFQRTPLLNSAVEQHHIMI